MSQPFLPLVSVFGDEEIAGLFSERALVDCYLEVECALAQAQGEFGVIPPEAAVAILTEASAAKVDLAKLREDTRRVGYPILPLLEQVSALSQPLVGAYMHWGATTQDIMDTGLVLIIERALGLVESALADVIAGLAALADEHRSTVIAARTHGQQAVPTTFGAKLAVFVEEYARHDERLGGTRQRVVRVQLFGAAGTGAALGPCSRQVRHRLAELLAIQPTDVPWHTARDGLAELGFVLAAIASTCGKLAREVIDLSRTEIGEVSEALDDHRGASSTMPQKANPIVSEVIVGMSAVARQLVPALLEAMQARHERSAGEWQIEWDVLPALFSLSYGALLNSLKLLRGLLVFPQRMQANLEADGGMLMAEAVMIALAPTLGRLSAHQMVYDACREARSRGIGLAAILPERLDSSIADALPPLEELLDPRSYLGEADAVVSAALATTIRGAAS